MIMSRPKEVVEEEISRQGSVPTVAPVKPAHLSTVQRSAWWDGAGEGNAFTDAATIPHTAPTCLPASLTHRTPSLPTP